MVRISIDIDCKEEHCGKCRCAGECEGIEWCGAFAERLNYDPEAMDFPRLPKCMEAEKKANQELLDLHDPGVLK